jgi:gliding motility-associated-like protein
LLPNKKQWQIYLVTRHACNLTDTLSSNYALIDNTPPALLDLDSVSVDLSTQKIIAGWAKAPEPDVMGYSIFKVDPSTGNNILLKDTSSLFYRFTTSTFNSGNTSNRIAIAVFDSCSNGGIICNYHSPIFTSFDMSSNTNYRCTRKFTFSWTPYVGWSPDRYGVWVEIAASGQWVYLGDVKNTSYTFNIPQLFQNYRFFVRAFKSPGNSAVTSTSNTISVSLPGYPKPIQNEIGHVSVLNGNTIEITGKWSSTNPGYTGELYYSENGFTWNKLQNTTNTFNAAHKNLFVSSQKYHYKNIVFNPCGEPCDTSPIHTSILLSRLGLGLFWNSYDAWFPLVKQSLEEKSKVELLWNGLYTGTNNSYFLNDTSQGLCFRVLANKNNGQDSAFSNVLCISVIDTTLIPSGFNPEGSNPVFKIVNPNIEKGQAVLSIFDRWGGKLWEGDALSGWNGQASNNLLPAGFYVYKVVIKRKEKNELFAGTVFLIR